MNYFRFVRIGKATFQLVKNADHQCVLNTNRGHWSIQNSCHYIIDWNGHKVCSRISKGYGLDSITRLRRFAVSIIKPKGSTQRHAENATTLLRYAIDL